MLLLFLLFTITISSNCQFNSTLSSDELFTCLDTLQITEEHSRLMKDSLISVFHSYVFKDIAKNPPQPEDNNLYFPSVDIDEMINSLEVKDQLLYPYYQKIVNAILNLHDYHVYFLIESSVDYEYIVDYICVLLPFYIEYTAEKNIIFYPLVELVLFDIDLPKDIVLNKAVPVKSVNGIDVFEWVQQYADKYVSLKNSHARFTYASQMIGLQFLNDVPMTREEIDEVFTIEYVTGNVTSVTQILANFGPIKGNERKNQMKRNMKFQQLKRLNKKNNQNENDEMIDEVSDEKEILSMIEEENINVDNFDKYNQLLKEVRNIDNDIDDEISSQVKSVYNKHSLKTETKEQIQKQELITKKMQQIKQRNKIIESINKKRSNGKNSYKPITPRDMFIETVDERLKKEKKASPYNFFLAETIGCNVSTINNKQVNLLYLPTFGPEEKRIDSFIEIFNDCIQLFDENDGPIVVVLPLNGGGYVDLEAYVEKTLCPTCDAHQYGSVRIHDQTIQAMENGYYELFTDPETCEYTYKNTSSHGDFYDNPTIDYFGDIQHVRTQTKRIETYGTEIYLKKHPRKPTDILLFTDSFCFSACSILTKGLNEKGGAITVGFFGNPKQTDKVYDSGQSPTLVAAAEEMLSSEQFLQLQTIGMDFQVSFAETYRYDYTYKQTIPREYLIDPVDEYIFLSNYNDDLLEEFATEALRIHEKYQTECNPKNKHLVKRTSECDNQISIEHAHGGYVCGDDGKWSTTCVASYCDDGYYFDFINQICYQEKCNYTEDPSSSTTPPTSSTVPSASSTSVTSNENENETSLTESSESNTFVVISEFSADHTEAWYSYVLISIISVFIILIILSFLVVGTIAFIKSKKESGTYAKIQLGEGLV